MKYITQVESIFCQTNYSLCLLLNNQDVLSDILGKSFKYYFNE